MANKIARKLIGVEIKLGFFYVPVAMEAMPQENTKLRTLLDGKERALTYNFQYKRIFGLSGWYKSNNAKIGDFVSFERLKDGSYSLAFQGISAETPIAQAEKLLDLSGLSSQAKGDIVEERIKELVVLHGQGLLSVYRPVTDTQGVDLIVTKAGQYQPIFLQVKGRFNVEKAGFFLMDINSQTFTPHESYLVVGAYFNPETLEIDEHLLLVPSSEVAEAPQVTSKGKVRYRVQTALSFESESRWAKYLIKKTELANNLIEKFDEMAKYIK